LRCKSPTTGASSGGIRSLKDMFKILRNDEVKKEAAIDEEDESSSDEDNKPPVTTAAMGNSSPNTK
jgi:hypothetical protein